MTATNRPKPQPKPFDLQRAEAELGRIKRRAKRLEGQAIAQIRKQINEASMSAYRAGKLEAFVGDVRAFLDGGK